MPREMRRITDTNTSAAPSRRAGDVATIRIPLNLKSIVAPYRDRGRFTIRLEQLPQSARLSAGINNGDRTWSLALDELEDLAYFAPAGAGPHTLGVRLIVKDDDGAHTLALIDLAVDADADAAADKRDGAAVIALAQDKSLQAELAQLRAALSQRDEALAQRDEALAARDAELVNRDAELAERDTELAHRGARLDAREKELQEQQQMNSWMTALAEENRETELADAKRAWAEGEAERREALQRELDLKFRETLADQDRRSGAVLDALNHQHEEALAQQRRELTEARRAAAMQMAEKTAWHGEVVKLQQEFEERLRVTRSEAETERARLEQEFEERLRVTRSEAETERARLEQEFADRLDAARQTGETAANEKVTAALAQLDAQVNAQVNAKAEALANAKAAAQLDEKLAAAESGWLTRLAELAARCEVAEARLAAQASIPQTPAPPTPEPQAAVCEPDTAAEIARLKAQLECVEQDAQWALKEARVAFEKEMVATLKAAEAEWQNQVALAQTDASVLADLRAQLERALAEGEAGALAARAETEQEMLAKLKSVEGEWRQRSDKTAAELTQRLGEAEAALAEANKQNAAEADTYIRELNAELRNLRKSLVGREAELARLKAVLDEERAGVTRGSAPAAAWKPVMGHHSMRDAVPEKGDRRLMRDAGIVAAVVMAAVLAWPYVSPWFFDQPAPAPVAAVARPKPVPVGAILSIATVERGVNLRGGPSVKDKVLGSVAKGDGVTILEERGNWVRGVVTGKGRPSVEGWLYKTALSESRTAAAPAR